MFSGEIERNDWLKLGYVEQISIPPGTLNKTISWGFAYYKFFQFPKNSMGGL